MRRRDLLKAISSLPATSLAFQNSSRASQAPPSSKKYSATWDSIDSRPSPHWYTDAKFGIFIHWGVYSVPAFAPVNAKNQTPYAEWYWHSLTNGMKAKGPNEDGAATWAFHKRTYGADFPYFDFAPMFRAEFFDPDRWADLFAKSGARYIALTSKHHEGFTLWRNEQANKAYGRLWNSVDIGPKRDLLLDLMLAGRRNGLQMGIYYSLYEWYNPLWLSDKQRFVREHLFPQFKDVVTHAKPAIIFSDGEWELPSDEWHSPELLAWLFNESPVADSVVIDDRWGKDTRHKHGGYYTTEYTSGMQQSDHPWEESRGMGFSYGYNRNETLTDYHTDRQLVLMLIDIVSRGGNLLLDIGPRADGGIPVVMEERLKQIGDWLHFNGEAIYSTRPWIRASQWSAGAIPHLEQKESMAEYDISKMVDKPPAGYARIEAFFTAKNDVVYAMLPQWPEGEFIFNNTAATPDAKITLLETGNPVEWRADGAQLIVKLAPELRWRVPPRPAYVLKMAGVKGT
jgi:alpha-L-fucosidase